MHQSNVYIKQKLQVWRVQKCIPLVGAKTALTCAALETTPSHVSQYRIDNRNLRKSELPFAIQPCLHQSNVYIKRKLQVWRTQKCIPLIGANPALTCPGLQTTTSHVNQYRAENGNLRKSGSTFRHGTVFAPKQCLYQKKATGMETPKMHSSSRCKNRTCAGLQTIPSHLSQYRAENGNLRISGSTFRHGTVFALKQCLYQKEATGMESPNMHSSTRCKNQTYLCESANYPFSCKPV